MRKSCFNDEFLVLLGPIISRLFTCSNEEKNLKNKQRVLALVISLWQRLTDKQLAFGQRCRVAQAEEAGHGVAEDGDQPHGRELLQPML
jgi:hypothetical protein